MNSYALLPSPAGSDDVPGKWAPGKSVLTSQDHADWLAWRRERKRAQQRDRRARLRRIDYYASPDAAAVLEGLWRSAPGFDFSSIIDRIVRAWASVPPE
jgi:hypothetical protein